MAKGDAKDLVGLSIDAAKALLGKREHRIISIDGVPRMVTADFRAKRYNLTIVKGKVTEVRMG